jgi:hypothetical protein
MTDQNHAMRNALIGAIREEMSKNPNASKLDEAGILDRLLGKIGLDSDTRSGKKEKKVISNNLRKRMDNLRAQAIEFQKKYDFEYDNQAGATINRLIKNKEYGYYDSFEKTKESLLDNLYAAGVKTLEKYFKRQSSIIRNSGKLDKSLKNKINTIVSGINQLVEGKEWNQDIFNGEAYLEYYESEGFSPDNMPSDEEQKSILKALYSERTQGMSSKDPANDKKDDEDSIIDPSDTRAEKGKRQEPESPSDGKGHEFMFLDANASPEEIEEYRREMDAELKRNADRIEASAQTAGKINAAVTDTAEELAQKTNLGPNDQEVQELVALRKENEELKSRIDGLSQTIKGLEQKIIDLFDQMQKAPTERKEKIARVVQKNLDDLGAQVSGAVNDTKEAAQETSQKIEDVKDAAQDNVRQDNGATKEWDKKVKNIILSMGISTENAKVKEVIDLSRKSFERSLKDFPPKNKNEEKERIDAHLEALQTYLEGVPKNTSQQTQSDVSEPSKKKVTSRQPRGENQSPQK